jgi:tricarballylate dehydrogenase
MVRRGIGAKRMHTSDVLVIGKGNAALCAALAARDAGASVTMLEAASQEESGGNVSYFTQALSVTN